MYIHEGLSKDMHKFYIAIFYDALKMYQFFKAARISGHQYDILYDEI